MRPLSSRLIVHTSAFFYHFCKSIGFIGAIRLFWRPFGPSYNHRVSIGVFLWGGRRLFIRYNDAALLAIENDQLHLVRLFRRLWNGELGDLPVE